MTTSSHALNLNRLATPAIVLPIVLITLLVLAGLVQPSFVSPRNLQDILTQAAPLCIVVIGQTFVILVRGLDLSVASVMATVAVIATAFNTTDNAFVPQIVLLSLTLGLLVGLINGYLVVKRNVSPFLATLAMMTVLQGGRFYYTQGAPGGSLPTSLRYLGAGHLWGVPVNLIVVAIVLAVAAILLSKSILGRKIYIVGGNSRSAELVGIRSDRITIFCYVTSSVLAALAGLVLVGFVGSVDNWVGRGYELDSIVAAVIGGIALTGGRGSPLYSVLGAIVLMVTFNFVIIVGLPVQAQFIIKGVVIIAAAALFRKIAAS
ncbi:ABC transporter permease [Brucella sp. NBRC 12950]|uniref:ABC transporter permease n=1 Tax=Brucella sp. NBRC 12950 TaxID=2994518 RepID=UPI0024A39FDE|nr:ABC transporter permease [Brucella sp. NBRC 12950]GLU30031.1 ribose ABC transporter permease [Brucella sp. NBRC 12950]